MQRSPILTAMAAGIMFLAADPAAAQEPNFGRAVSITGSELLVGQPVNWYGPGVVYSYRLDGSGGWSDPATLTASDSSRMDDFGRALALDGNTLVVGAPRKHDGSGVVYTFARTSPTAEWREVDILLPPGDDDHAEYATALALSGDDLLVGSPVAAGTGVVYHFQRASESWTLAGVIRPGSGEGAGGFGRSLAWEGNRLLVGAPEADSARGEVYAVERGTEGWGEPQRVVLPPELDVAGAGAGTALLLSGTRAWVGAPGRAAVAVLQDAGSGAWSADELLLPPVEPRGSRFGFSLASAGDEIWVGAPGVDGANGQVFGFMADASGGWQVVATLEPDATVGASWPMGFGHAVAVSDGRGVVGMPTRDFGEGRVMVLEKREGAWQQDALLEGVIYRIGNTLEPGTRCEEGVMAEFTCSNMELVGHLSVDDLGGERGVWVNDVWGWEDRETGRDYALVARRDGASFVDVTDPAAPRVVGNLPRTLGSRPSVWRDIKVIDDHAYIVADGAGAHGMQVFDLTRLRSVGSELETFEPDATYREIFSAHNVAADTASKFLYIAGANSGGQTCGGGLHIVDASEPQRPVFAGCHHDPSGPGSRGYAHDAQCLVYQGPDERYQGREICVSANEDELNIADMSDKANPVTIGRQSYPNVAYAHQGWFDDEQRYFYMNDELDESAGLVEGTRTIIWDLLTLDDPVVANEYIGPVMATDHNLYIVGDRMFQSNYGSGLRVIDISDRVNPYELGFFDSAPYNDDGAGTSASQSGAWSNYPFFPSGLVIFTSVREGLFIMRVTPPPTS